MEWLDFHHPDICLPVLRRRIGSDLLHYLSVFGEYAITGGNHAVLMKLFDNANAYRTAKHRLRKAGLIVERNACREYSRIEIAEAGKSEMAKLHKPEKYWKRKWDGRWYILMYDVPESSRYYRDTLRRFLKRMHMGGLQKSIWITPHDIRPEYADLIKAANVDRFSLLMESRTVLGCKASDLVESAWKMDELVAIQQHFCKACAQNTELTFRSTHTDDDLRRMAREELHTYLSIMEEDPLLPSSLHPQEYIGPEVVKAHREFTRSVARRIKG